jgi:DNA-binding transcriptional regulator YiaG
VTGAQVKRIRVALSLTQYEFARRLGVHPVTVAKWETDAQGMRGPAARLIALLSKTATTADTKNAPAPRRAGKARRAAKRKRS